MTADFPTTRALVATLPEWLHALADQLPKPLRIPHPKGQFRWEYPDKTPEVAQVAKAVRMVSGIAAALRLADAGFTTDCGTLLRTVADFAAEILFIGEGLLNGQLNAAQQQFVDQYFTAFPTSPDELAEREREYYIGRKDILAAHRRLVAPAGIDPGFYDRVAKYLNKGYDGYVHGAYGTAMELFSGRDYRFMVTGNESPRALCVAKVSVAGKLHEVIAALEFMALTRRLEALHFAIMTGRHALEQSEENSGRQCEHL